MALIRVDKASGTSGQTIEKIINGGSEHSNELVTINVTGLCSDYANLTIDNFLFVPLKYTIRSGTMNNSTLTNLTYNPSTGMLSGSTGPTSDQFATLYDLYVIR